MRSPLAGGSQTNAEPRGSRARKEGGQVRVRKGRREVTPSTEGKEGSGRSGGGGRGTDGGAAACSPVDLAPLGASACSTRPRRNRRRRFVSRWPAWLKAARDGATHQSRRPSSMSVGGLSPVAPLRDGVQNLSELARGSSRGGIASRSVALYISCSPLANGSPSSLSIDPYCAPCKGSRTNQSTTRQSKSMGTLSRLFINLFTVFLSLPSPRTDTSTLASRPSHRPAPCRGRRRRWWRRWEGTCPTQEPLVLVHAEGPAGGSTRRGGPRPHGREASKPTLSTVAPTSSDTERGAAGAALSRIGTAASGTGSRRVLGHRRR